MTDEKLATAEATDAEEAGDEELTPAELAEKKLKEAVQVKTEEVGTLRVKLTVTVPREILDDRLTEQFSELKRDAAVPGFRKGRAPLQLIQKRFGHEVGDQLVSQVVGASYLAATEKANINPVGDPLIWVQAPEERSDSVSARRREKVDRLVTIEQAFEYMELPTEGELTYSCEVELRPEFDLPKLEKIPVERPSVEITDEDVTHEIDRMRAHRGQWEPVEKGVVKADDLIYGEVKVVVGDTTLIDESNAVLAARNQVYGGVLLEALGKDLVGKKAGDQIETKGRVRDDHAELELRGKDATVHVTIHEVKRLALPKLDKAFIEGLGFENKKDMQDSVRAEMDSRLGQVMQRALRGQIIKYIVDNTKLDLPDGLSQRQVEWAATRRMIDTYQQGMPKEQVEKEMDNLRASTREKAIEDLKLHFIMDKIAEEHEVEVSDDELNGAIAQIARHHRERFDRTRDELSKGDGLNALYLQIRDEKILDHLLTQAEIKEVEGPKKPDPEQAKKKTAKKRKKVAKKVDGDSADEH
ncbi:MAG: trigger factor [Planctomycetes bacterium]|nr:trigger factor [Planctomycetota bacterium]